jgi:anti-sigma28 factor (negative regulator of flagellin synthesis)
MRRIRVSTPSTAGRAVTTYVHMTVLAVRDVRREGRFGRVSVRRAPERTPTSESRMMHVERIMESVRRDEYAVDADKVAEAILRRLLTGEGQCS